MAYRIIFEGANSALPFILVNSLKLIPVKDRKRSTLFGPVLLLGTEQRSKTHG